ncbi:MAG: glutamyl-tRNA reductase, partial [Dehalococcoidia bacterium]
MRIMVVGLNHQSAPLDLREQVSISSGELSKALEILGEKVGNGVILSTCNRSEVYAIVPSVSRGTEDLKGFLATYHHVARREIEPHLYVYSQREAVRHLDRVTCGLDSLILGESQILGQVRDAYAAANQHGLAKGVLSRLFHHALRAGKRARRETNIGRNALSISRAAVELARRALGDIRDKRVLVIGLGDAGKLAARALADAGATDITVTNRTYQRATDLASELGGKAVPFDRLGEMLRNTDIVVSATGSPGYIVTPDLVMPDGENHNSPMFLIDIAVPRDVDPAINAISHIHVYDLDDLETVAEINRRRRKAEAQKVEAIVVEEVDRFMDGLLSLEVVPTVAALREQAESIRSREL